GLGAAADLAPTLTEERGWVDLIPQPSMHLKVQVRAGGVPGVSLPGDEVAGFHLLTRDHVDGASVGIVGEVPVAVIDDDRIAVTGIQRAGGEDSAGAGSADRRSVFAGEVQALVHSAPPRSVA